MLPTFGPSNAHQHPGVRDALSTAAWTGAAPDFFVPQKQREGVQHREVVIDGFNFPGRTEILRSIPGLPSHILREELPAAGATSAEEQLNCYLLVKPETPHIWYAAGLTKRCLRAADNRADYTVDLLFLYTPIAFRGQKAAAHLARSIGYMAAIEAYQIATTSPRTLTLHPIVRVPGAPPAAEALGRRIQLATHTGLHQLARPVRFWGQPDRACIADVGFTVMKAASAAAAAR